MSELNFVTLDAELPGSGGEIWYYPPGDHVGEQVQSRRVLRVDRLDAPAWFGAFAAGVMGCDHLMQFAADPESFVLVYKGAAYRVNVADPSKWQPLGPCESITHLEYFPSADILVVVSAGSLSADAYNASSHLWSSPRLALDEVQIVGRDGDTVTIAGNNEALGEGTVHVVLRVSDGTIVSGRPFRWEDRILYRLVPSGATHAR